MTMQTTHTTHTQPDPQTDSDKLVIFDTTLRDGEQSAGAVGAGAGIDARQGEPGNLAGGAIRQDEGVGAAASATCSGLQRKHNFSRAAAQANTPTRGDPTPARIRAARSCATPAR